MASQTDPGDVAACSSDTVYIETNAPGTLGDQGTSLEGVIDTLYAVILHRQQKTAANNVYEQYYTGGALVKYTFLAFLL